MSAIQRRTGSLAIAAIAALVLMTGAACHRAEERAAADTPPRPTAIATTPARTAPAVAAYSMGAIGYAVSSPQCSSELPQPPFAFAIIGITAGWAFTQNPCLADEYAWARRGSAPVSVYMNTNYNPAAYPDVEREIDIVEEVARRIAPFGWHIEINIARSADWVELEPRLRKCPVPLVFDHMGRVRGAEGPNAPGFAVIRRMLAERENCWTKISSFYRLSDSGPPHYGDMRPFVQTLLKERPDRCVWGTNWPHPGLTEFMPNDCDLLDLLESWLPGDAVREPLFVGNAAKLYRFGA